MTEIVKKEIKIEGNLELMKLSEKRSLENLKSEDSLIGEGNYQEYENKAQFKFENFENYEKNRTKFTMFYKQILIYDQKPVLFS